MNLRKVAAAISWLATPCSSLASFCQYFLCDNVILRWAAGLCLAPSILCTSASNTTNQWPSALPLLFDVLTHYSSRRPYTTAQFDDKDELNNNDGNGINKSDDGEKSTETVSSDQNGEAFEVDITYRNNMITWQDADGQMQHVEGLYLDLYVDTATNTAIFKLYGYVLLKGSKAKSSKQAIYLFIHPESVQTITLQTGHAAAPFSTLINFGPTHHSLCFSLTAPPHLVVPKNLVLESRPKTRALLDSIQALATMMTFTVHLNHPDMATSTQKDLALISSIFSLSHNDNRPSTNNRRANLTTLYAGRGGEIVYAKDDIANADTCLPPYSETTPSRSHISSEQPISYCPKFRAHP